MRTPIFTHMPRLVPVLAFAALAACGDGQPIAGVNVDVIRPPTTVLQALDCQASTAGTMRCDPAGPGADGTSRVILGGDGTYVQLTSSNPSYDSITQIFKFDVTITNLLNEAIGTANGVVPDPEGIRAFFHSEPYPTQGTGDVTIANADGISTFLTSDVPYFLYPEILDKNEVSAAKTWKFNVPPTVGSFSFRVYVATNVQYLLVINELLANPGGTISDTDGEWFEVYNAGTFGVNLQNLLISDSAAAGRRPYHAIASSVSVAPGEYAVLGITTNTASNGGVPVDHAYASALALANSLDAIKISRVFGSDTLTVDRVTYTNPAISARNGASRELINPSLDNSNIDGGNWADGTVSYGAGGLGTPRAQNTAFIP